MKGVNKLRRKDEKKNETIKKSLIKLILQNGFNGTSISKIAKEAGVSPATIYIYYENKDIMIHEIYHELRMEQESFLLDNIAPDTNAKAAMETIFKSYKNYIDNHEEEHFFIKQFYSCPCMYEEVKNHKHNLKLEELINKYKKNKEIKNINNKIIISLLLAPIEQIAENILGYKGVFSEEEINQMFEVVWNTIKY